MNKQSILQFVNDLIEKYEEAETTAIEETASDISGSLYYLQKECNELREEIKVLLEIK